LPGTWLDTFQRALGIRSHAEGAGHELEKAAEMIVMILKRINIACLKAAVL
jgi:histidine ammonia-lyase